MGKFLFSRYVRSAVCCISLGLSAGRAFGQEPITPNDFEGSDTQRIQQAVDAARGTTGSITIPRRNANGTCVWKIDSAILLPSDMTVVLDNCLVQLSDSCRDNMFRSDNVGIGIEAPVWNERIAIVGVGDAVLRGADNPRATGDGLRNLSLDPAPNHNRDRSSYGSDAGRAGCKQKSDWRNFLILMAYVRNFELKNVRIEYAHCWAVNFERVHHAELSHLRFYTPQYRCVGGERRSKTSALKYQVLTRLSSAALTNRSLDSLQLKFVKNANQSHIRAKVLSTLTKLSSARKVKLVKVNN